MTRKRKELDRRHMEEAAERVIQQRDPSKCTTLRIHSVRKHAGTAVFDVLEYSIATNGIEIDTETNQPRPINARLTVKPYNPLDAMAIYVAAVKGCMLEFGPLPKTMIKLPPIITSVLFFSNGALEYTVEISLRQPLSQVERSSCDNTHQ